MKRVFIAGSKSIKSLSSFQENEIKQHLTNNNLILLKNNYDIDYELQNLCNNESYMRVFIFSLLHKPNKTINKEWHMMFIPPKNNDFENTINDRIISLCDYAIVLWDTKSQEDFSIIIKLIHINKKVILFIENQIVHINNKEDLHILLKYF